MPFTLAHPIAALPLWLGFRKRLDLTGLMVGAIVPDIHYFIALQPVGTFEHTLAGVLSFGLLEGLLLCGLWRYFLVDSAIALLPKVISERIQPMPQSGLFILVVSILLGALSHIFWDGFSHEMGWAVVHSQVLRGTVGRLVVYKWVQYLSGVLGLLGLFVWGLVWWRGAAVVRVAGQFRVGAWVGILSCGVLVGAIAIVVHAVPGEGLAAVVVRAVIGGISGGFLGLCGVGVVDALRDGKAERWR